MVPPSHGYLGSCYFPWFHISRLMRQSPSASRCSTSSIFPRPSKAGFALSGGCTTWCSEAHSDAQSPLTSIPRKSSSIVSIRQPFNRSVTSPRNLAISGLPTMGAVSGSRLTPSSAHILTIAGVSIFKCASRNFALNARISLRRSSSTGPCACLPSLSSAASPQKATASAAVHAAKTLRMFPPLFFCRRSINQLQRKLNLPRGPGRLVDDSESASAYHVVRQPKIHNVENVKKFRAKLQDAKFALPAGSERSIFDQTEIEIVIRRSAERVPAQSSKPPAVRARSSRLVGRNVEVRSVVAAHPKIVLAHRPAGRKIRLGHQIGPVRSRCPEPGLLHARKDGERRPARQRSDIQDLPAARQLSAERPQPAHFVKRQRFEQAQRENVRYIKRGGSALTVHIQGILGHGLQNHARIRSRAAQDRAGIVDRL